MKKWVLVSLLAVVGSASGQVIEVPNGDCRSLESAVDSVATQDQSQTLTVVLAANGEYDNCALLVPSGLVIVEGQGAMLRDSLICSVPTDDATRPSLTFRDVTIESSGEALSISCPADEVGSSSTVPVEHFTDMQTAPVEGSSSTVPVERFTDMQTAPDAGSSSTVAVER